MSDKSKQFTSLFVVIDPMQLIQPALIKGESIATTDRASLHLYCCIFDERFANDSAEQQQEVDLTREWLERLAAPGRKDGLDIEVQVEWNQDWREAVVDAANASGCGLVIKTVSHHSAVGRRLVKTSDWMMLEGCTSPVLLVSGHRGWQNKKLLAAVKVKPEDEVHERLNSEVIDTARNLSTGAGLGLYVVTAYKGDGIFYDRQRFADLCGLPRNNVFSEEGAPEHAIAKVVDNIAPDVVVVGNPGKATGSTARRLIDQVNVDLLVLPDQQHRPA